jgi:hypothetical protein
MAGAYLWVQLQIKNKDVQGCGHHHARFKKEISAETA